jgi:hypothetical protein
MFNLFIFFILALFHVGFVCLFLQNSLILIGVSHILGSSQNSPHM